MSPSISVMEGEGRVDAHVQNPQDWRLEELEGQVQAQSCQNEPVDARAADGAEAQIGVASESTLGFRSLREVTHCMSTWWTERLKRVDQWAQARFMAEKLYEEQRQAARNAKRAQKPVRMCEEIYNADEITAYIVAVSQTGTNLDEETAGKRTRASSIWNNVWNNYWGLD